jgi:hypothetical protein
MLRGKPKQPIKAMKKQTLGGFCRVPPAFNLGQTIANTGHAVCYLSN